MVFTTLIFIGSLLLLVVAGILYVPLLCYIRGNLKEYVCHKVDKRIADLLKKKARERVKKQADLAKKEAAGDFSHIKNKKGGLPVAAVVQPTLPSVMLDDDDILNKPKQDIYGQHHDDGYWGTSENKSDYASSNYTGYTQEYGHEYPPMPGYYGDANGGPGDNFYHHDSQGYHQGTDDAYHNTPHLGYQGPPPMGGPGYEDAYYHHDQHGNPPNDHYAHSPPQGRDLTRGRAGDGGFAM